MKKEKIDKIFIASKTAFIGAGPRMKVDLLVDLELYNLVIAELVEFCRELHYFTQTTNATIAIFLDERFAFLDAWLVFNGEEVSKHRVKFAAEDNAYSTSKITLVNRTELRYAVDEIIAIIERFNKLIINKSLKRKGAACLAKRLMRSVYLAMISITRQSKDTQKSFSKKYNNLWNQNWTNIKAAQLDRLEKIRKLVER
jgi:hypothetical protein